MTAAARQGEAGPAVGDGTDPVAGRTGPAVGDRTDPVAGGAYPAVGDGADPVAGGAGPAERSAGSTGGGAAGRVPWPVPFVLLAATWGCSFWFIKEGLRFLHPVQVSCVRCVLGALALLALSAATRVPLPRSARTWGHLLVMSLLLNSVPLTLFAYGETRISSILAAIINGAAPLTTLVATVLVLPGERLDAGRAVGLAVGFVGVLTVVRAWDGVGSGQGLGVLACVGAVCCYGLSFPYSRRFLHGPGDRPVALATGQLVWAAAMLLPFGIAAGRPTGPVTAGPVLAMVVLGVLGTGVAYVWNYRLIREIGPTAASTVTYLVPAFAVLVGVAFLHEPLTWNLPVGGVVLLVGVAAAQGRLRGLSRAAGSAARRRRTA